VGPLESVDAAIIVEVPEGTEPGVYKGGMWTKLIMASSPGGGVKMSTAIGGTVHVTVVAPTCSDSDTSAPVIACPQDMVVHSCDGSGSAVVNFADAVAMDDCKGVTVTQTDGPSGGGVFGVGETQVRFEAVDGAGHSSHRSFIVTLEEEARAAPAEPAPAPAPDKPITHQACEVEVDLGKGELGHGIDSLVRDVPLPAGAEPELSFTYDLRARGSLRVCIDATPETCVAGADEVVWQAVDATDGVPGHAAIALASHLSGQPASIVFVFESELAASGAAVRQLRVSSCENSSIEVFGAPVPADDPADDLLYGFHCTAGGGPNDSGRGSVLLLVLFLIGLVGPGERQRLSASTSIS
jgi:hypothetical protein